MSLAILAPGAALAGSLLTTEDVEQSMPAGTKFLVGTEPACEVVKSGVEYRCTIKGAFKSEIDGSLKGTVEPTVDATKHVNGGCRSLHRRRARVVLLHRRGGRQAADHRARLPRRVRALARASDSGATAARR